MYIVSRVLKPVPAEELDHFEQQHAISLPLSYRNWIEHYGEGTYTGWMNVQRPDPEVLKPFVQYDFWIHTDESPISLHQLEQCITIGSSVDGDFLAVHPEVDGLLWLPRHDENITLWTCSETEFGETLDRIYCGYYRQDKPIAPSFYEPWNELRKHAFYHFSGTEQGSSMQALAEKCKTEYEWDAVLENEYMCKLFMASMGGYVRFNYATGREVALFYEEKNGAEEATDNDISLFLQAHHCTVHEQG